MVPGRGFELTFNMLETKEKFDTDVLPPNMPAARMRLLVDACGRWCSTAKVLPVMTSNLLIPNHCGNGHAATRQHPYGPARTAPALSAVGIAATHM
jgi:hypothetical protein